MSSFEQSFCRSAPWRAFARRVVLPWALQEAEPVGDVLEIGGGSGAMAAQVLEAFPRAQLTVTDFDESMVASARTRLAAFADRARCQRADATALPFDDASFDYALSFIMLHHVIDWEKALTEAVRVLRPGGQLVGYDLLSSVPMRVLHEAEGARHRFMTLHGFRDAIATLPLERTVLAIGPARLTVRFACQKAR